MYYFFPSFLGADNKTTSWSFSVSKNTYLQGHTSGAFDPCSQPTTLSVSVHTIYLIVEASVD